MKRGIPSKPLHDHRFGRGLHRGTLYRVSFGRRAATGHVNTGIVLAILRNSLVLIALTDRFRGLDSLPSQDDVTGSLHGKVAALSGNR